MQRVARVARAPPDDELVVPLRVELDVHGLLLRKREGVEHVGSVADEEAAQAGRVVRGKGAVALYHGLGQVERDRARAAVVGDVAVVRAIGLGHTAVRAEHLHDLQAVLRAREQVLSVADRWFIGIAGQLVGVEVDAERALGVHLAGHRVGRAVHEDVVGAGLEHAGVAWRRDGDEAPKELGLSTGHLGLLGVALIQADVHVGNEHVQVRAHCQLDARGLLQGEGVDQVRGKGDLVAGRVGVVARAAGVARHDAVEHQRDGVLAVVVAELAEAARAAALAEEAVVETGQAVHLGVHDAGLQQVAFAVALAWLAVDGLDLERKLELVLARGRVRDEEVAARVQDPTDCRLAVELAADLAARAGAGRAQRDVEQLIGEQVHEDAAGLIHVERVDHVSELSPEGAGGGVVIPDPRGGSLDHITGLQLDGVRADVVGRVAESGLLVAEAVAAGQYVPPRAVRHADANQVAQAGPLARLADRIMEGVVETVRTRAVAPALDHQVVLAGLQHGGEHLGVIDADHLGGRVGALHAQGQDRVPAVGVELNGDHAQLGHGEDEDIVGALACRAAGALLVCRVDGGVAFVCLPCHELDRVLALRGALIGDQAGQQDIDVARALLAVHLEQDHLVHWARVLPLKVLVVIIRAGHCDLVEVQVEQGHVDVADLVDEERVHHQGGATRDHEREPVLVSVAEGELCR